MGVGEMAARTVRVGVDLTLVPRVAELAGESGFLARVFQPAELGDTRPEHLAGLLAAKEACFKALGVPAPGGRPVDAASTGGVHPGATRRSAGSWRDVEVTSDPDGRPRLRLAASLRPPGLVSLDLSISHEGPFAVAVVVALLDG